MAFGDDGIGERGLFFFIAVLKKMVIEKKLNKLPLIYSMVRYLIKKTFFTYFKVEIGYFKGKWKYTSNMWKIYIGKFLR